MRQIGKDNRASRGREKGGRGEGEERADHEKGLLKTPIIKS